MNYTISFCCNDDRGTFTGRVVEVGIEDEMRLESSTERGLLMKWTERPRYTNVQVSRRAFACSGSRQVCIGNVFWDAAGMSVKQAREFAAYLIARGWTVVEHACEGPFADLVKR